jgi:glutamate--cysteine ligase
MGASGNDPAAARPIRELDELSEVFRDAEKPKSAWRIGCEAEKFGVRAGDGAPIQYQGEHGVLRVLEALARNHGWAPKSETPAGPIISLERGKASITLEPGAQLELSGEPCADVHAICAEMRQHMAELADITQEMNLNWLGVGFHPLARQDELPWVPKQRYSVMKRYLPTQGPRALDMMRRTATVQANFDFSDETDAMRKLRVSLVLAPVINAICANSPFYEGAPAGKKSVRGEVWLAMDPARSGLIPAFWSKPELRYRDYVEWALDAGMFLIWRDGQVVHNTGQTFRSFMKDGYQGHTATIADWKLHVNTLFPEARIKSTLEVRACDSLPTDLSCTVPALYTGLLYDDRALVEAEALTETLAFEDVAAARVALVTDGFAASIGRRPMRKIAERIVDIAMGGLERRCRFDSHGRDERIHLERIADLVSHGLCPADRLLEGLDPKSPDLRREIIERTRA